jgi:hypothetical protein
LSAKNGDLPVCVDLDGTFWPVDITKILLKYSLNSWQMYQCLIEFLRGGRARAKAYIAKNSHIQVDSISINANFYSFLVSLHQSGRQIILVTGAPAKIAQQVVEAYPIFTDFIASDDYVNCVGIVKGERLAARFGWQQYVYAGNSWQDIPVWRGAAQVIGVGCSSNLKRFLQTFLWQEKTFFEG